ncbi:MAG: hypothetical protein MJZ38_05610 [archaeon]|nr:hypothetical protein [archaeon]
MAFKTFRCTGCERTTMIDDEESRCHCIYCGTILFPMGETATPHRIVVRCGRSSNFLGRHRFIFRVDGRDAGECETGGSMTFELMNGPHEVEVTVPQRRGSSSGTTRIDVSGDAAYRIEFGTFDMEPSLVSEGKSNRDDDSLF